MHKEHFSLRITETYSQLLSWPGTHFSFSVCLVSCSWLAHSSSLEPSGHWPFTSLLSKSRSNFHSVSLQRLTDKAQQSQGARLVCIGSKHSSKHYMGRKHSGLRHVHGLARMSPNLLSLPSGYIPAKPTSSDPSDIPSYPASSIPCALLLTVVSQEQGWDT